MSRRGSERSSCGAIATNAGCVTVPARFFPPGRLIAVFPPIAASTAAIGGKTAINLPGGKNLAGTVTQPAFVAIAPQLLRSLPRRDIVSGYGEMLKYGLALDAGLYRAQRAVEAGIEREPVLEHLAVARDDVAARERAQQLRRDRDERRLRHRPRQVLSAGQVDRGLPADRGVDRREQRRRNADVRNAALKRRRREPDRVADRSAADADDAAAPVEAGGDEAFVQGADRRQRLERLVGGDGHRRGSESGVTVPARD